MYVRRGVSTYRRARSRSKKSKRSKRSKKSKKTQPKCTP